MSRRPVAGSNSAASVASARSSEVASSDMSGGPALPVQADEEQVHLAISCTGMVPPGPGPSALGVADGGRLAFARKKVGMPSRRRSLVARPSLAAAKAWMKGPRPSGPVP